MENPTKICFNRDIYIDKTGLLDFTNSVLGTKQAYIYVIAVRYMKK